MYNFPDHLIDPTKKDEKWILDYCRAAWHQNAGTTHGSYLTSVYRYQYLLDYAQGKQSVSQYRKMFGIDEKADEEWLKISWEPLGILPRYLEMALARLKRYEYNVVSTPVDPQSQAEINDYFKKQEAKLEFRKGLEEVAPELVDASPVAKQADDPEDFDELKIMRQYSYKHQLAAELEEALEGILHDNYFEDERSQALEHALYYGLVGYKEEVGHDGRIYTRTCDPSQMVIAPSQRKDFKDAEYIGEVRFITIADLRRMAPELTENQLEIVAKKYLNQFGNPSRMPRTKLYARAYDDFKVRVLDLEFDSTNMMTYEESVDKRGNKRVSRAPLKKAGKVKKNGEYKSVPVGVVYRASWIIDTDIMYNYGLLRNMKRRNADFRKTGKSYHIRAYSMSGGRWTSKLEQCTQIIDQICLAWFKLQHEIASSRPNNGFSFDLDALEDVPLGRGGKQLTPAQVVDLLMKKNIFPYRSLDTDGNKTHYVPINQIAGGLGNAAVEYFQVIQQNIQLLQQVLGISEVSAGGAPERMATQVAELSDQSTEDSLASVAEAEKLSFESMLNGVSQRIKSLARTNEGKVYEFMLGRESMKFFKLSPEYSAREFAIKLENRPDVREKQELIQYANQFMSSGLVELDDIIMIKNTQNLKKAEMLIAHRIKKRKEEQQQQAMQQQQMNGQVQQQSAMVAEQAKQKTLQLEYQLKAQLMEMEKQYDLQIEQLRVTGKLQGDELKAGASMESTQMKAESDEYQTELLAAANQAREQSKERDDAMRK